MNPKFYFLLALTAVLAVTANARPVLDSDGDIISGSGSYYVLPFIFGPNGGGLTLVPRLGNRCPLFIGQAASEVVRGIPVKFSNWRPRVAFVPESSDLNIEMDVNVTDCGQSTYWRVTPAPSHFRSLFIAAGPKPEAGGEDSSRSFFQIKKIEGIELTVYKFVHCSDGNHCIDVGTNVEGGVRGLVLGSTPPFANPFEVVFVKATKIETSSKRMSII